MAQRLKRRHPMQETRVWSLGWEDPLEKEMATHSSILTWRIPWTKKPGELVCGVTRVRHHLATKPPPWTSGFKTQELGREGAGSPSWPQCVEDKLLLTVTPYPLWALTHRAACPAIWALWPLWAQIWLISLTTARTGRGDGRRAWVSQVQVWRCSF